MTIQQEFEDRKTKLKEGDKLTFKSSVSWQSGHYMIGCVTDDAIMISDEWIPKSQIVGISYEGIESLDDHGVTKYDTKDLVINKWFDDKI